MPFRAGAQDNVCHNDGSGREAYICAAQRTQAADVDLNAAYQHALAQLSGSGLMTAKVSLIESEHA
jgi:uncharacterized protein YecT (DUF1311 family)